MRGGTGGTGRRGGLAGIDTEESGDGGGAGAEYWKMPYPPNLYVAGFSNRFQPGSATPAIQATAIDQFQGGGGGSALYAIHERFGRAGTVVRLAQKYMGGGAPTGSACTMGIYTNVAIDDLYPDQLVAGTASFPLGADAVFLQAFGEDVSASVEANSLMWFVFGATTLAQVPATSSVIGILETAIEPILGARLVDGFFDGQLGRDQESFGIGWRHPYNGGAMPATFPRTAPFRLVNDSHGGGVRWLPAIYYGFRTD